MRERGHISVKQSLTNCTFMCEILKKKLLFSLFNFSLTYANYVVLDVGVTIIYYSIKPVDTSIGRCCSVSLKREVRMMAFVLLVCLLCNSPLGISLLFFRVNVVILYSLCAVKIILVHFVCLFCIYVCNYVSFFLLFLFCVLYGIGNRIFHYYLYAQMKYVLFSCNPNRMFILLVFKRCRSPVKRFSFIFSFSSAILELFFFYEISFSMCKLISLNVRAISNFKKRKAIFTWCRKQKADFVFLQETHSKKDSETCWKNEWDSEVIVAHGSSNSCGVAILFKKGIGCKIHSKILDPLGRYIMLKAEIEDKMYVLISTYDPNKDTNIENFLNNLLMTYEERRSIESKKISCSHSS